VFVTCNYKFQGFNGEKQSSDENLSIADFTGSPGLLGEPAGGDSDHRCVAHNECFTFIGPLAKSTRRQPARGELRKPVNLEDAEPADKQHHEATLASVRRSNEFAVSLSTG